jgi:arylsulfatase A-like enzyme
MITKTDESLGRLVEALKAQDKYADTALFVFSDHGEYAGDYRMVEKTQCTFEDDLTKVPLIVKYPEWVEVPKRDQPVDTLVELVDFYATVAELAHIPKRHTHFGKSLLPVSLGDVAVHREHVFCEGGALITEAHTHEPLLGRESVYWPRISVQNEHSESHGKAAMIRTADWKYVRRLYENDELYDLANDPGELRNVAADPQHSGIRRELAARMTRWFMETVDAVPYEPIMPKLEGKL